MVHNKGFYMAVIFGNSWNMDDIVERHSEILIPLKFFKLYIPSYHLVME